MNEHNSINNGVTNSNNTIYTGRDELTNAQQQQQQQQQLLQTHHVKRRRVTRACDECRKKKVKCDGQQPCIHCTVYSYDCTYNQPTKRFNSNVNNSMSTNTTVKSNRSQAFNSTSNNNNNNLSKNFNGKIDFNLNYNNNNTSATSKTKNTSTNYISNNNNIITDKIRLLQLQNEKYAQLFNELLPNMPNINSIDIPIFIQILHNFKANINDELNFLNDSVKEYFLITQGKDFSNENNSNTGTAMNSPNLNSSTFNSPDDINMINSLNNNSMTNMNSLLLKNISNNNNSNTSVDTVDTWDNARHHHYHKSSSMGHEIKIILPPKPIALKFVKNTWDQCCVLLRFYHRKSFLQQLEKLYETDPNYYTSEQMKFLPLVYSVMAVGALFSKSIESSTNDSFINTITSTNTPNTTNDNNSSNNNNLVSNDNIANSDTNNNHNNNETNDTNRNEFIDNSNNSTNNSTFLNDEGYKYFIAARKLIDITNTRDINSVQTVLMLFIFLQCSARLSTCYSYIGCAMRSVLREGYHRKVAPDCGLSAIEIEMRKRLFYTTYKLDIYVNAMLGLPRSISTDDFDQEFPVELSDENVTEDGYFPERQNGVLSSAGIANYHTKLLMILDRIMRKIYPLKKTNNIISHDTITKFEIELNNWSNELPIELKPDNKLVPQKYERANRLLYLSFLHVQIILYRPFIHYLSRNFATKNVDPLSRQRARNSLVVSRTVVRMAQEMLNKNFISGSYWYACYTIFYSVAGLLFYIHEADLPDKNSAREYYEVLRDAESGRNILIQLKDTSMAANRTYNILNKLFEKLTTRTIQLSTMHDDNENDNKNDRNNETDNNVNLSTSQKQAFTEPLEETESSISQTSSYNVNKFVNDVPLLSNPTMTNIEDSLNSTVDLNQVNSNDIFLKSGLSQANSPFEMNISPSTMVNMDSNMKAVSNGFNDNNNNSGNDNDNTGDQTLQFHNFIKRESDANDVGILNVFDQLDAHLFGKSMSQNNAGPSSN